MAILLLERLVRKRQNIEKGDSMDWATYVELQDNMRLLLNTHK